MYGLLWVKFTMHIKVWILISDFHIWKWQKISIKWYETQFVGYIYKWLRWTLKRIKKGANSPNKNWNEARYVLQQGGISSSTHANGHALLQEACILYLLLQFTQVFLWPCQYFNKISIWEQFYGNESQLCYQKKMATLTAWFISSQTEEISFFAIIFPKRPRMGVTGESIPCFLTGILRISAICMHTPCCKVRDNFHFQTRKTLFTVLCGTCNSQFKINAEKQTKRQIIKQNWDGLHLIT